jgi:hypothetical protein
MPTKKYKREHIATLPRQFGGEDRQRYDLTPHAFREAGITEQTFYCWRQEHRGLNLDQASRGPADKQGHHSKRQATKRASKTNLAKCGKSRTIVKRCLISSNPG